MLAILCLVSQLVAVLFVFNDTATTEIYTLSLHDALPISHTHTCTHTHIHEHIRTHAHTHTRSEEHTSELQSHLNLVWRLLLEKKILVSLCCAGHRWCVFPRSTAPARTPL